MGVRLDRPAGLYIAQARVWIVVVADRLIEMRYLVTDIAEGGYNVLAEGPLDLHGPLPDVVVHEVGLAVGPDIPQHEQGRGRGPGRQACKRIRDRGLRILGVVLVNCGSGSGGLQVEDLEIIYLVRIIELAGARP